MVNIINLAWYPTIGSDTSMLGITQSANNIANGILMPLVLLTIGIISLIGMTFTGRSFPRSLLFSSFICSILAILLVLMNMLSVNYMYFAFFLTAVGLVWVRLTEAPS